MCSRPPEIAPGLFVSCRECDECVSTKIQGWVARCMAEKHTMGYALALTLTYSERTAHTRAAAQSFRYADVRLFLANLRAQVKYHHGLTGNLRFLVCGEMGGDRGRVHWHMVVFSTVELRDFGTWEKYGRPYDGPREGRHNRLDWSMWPHGYVEIQRPDDNGMAYVVKYCQKDQFETEKARGTKRFEKSENYAASYFRMSKRPPVGHTWLQGHLDDLARDGQMPVSMCFKVPGYWGYWYPTGRLRIDILRYLRFQSDEREAAYGQRPAQERAFLASLSETDLEHYHGEQSDEEETEDEIARGAQRRSVEARERHRLAQASGYRKRCGGIYPCERCLDVLSETSLSAVADQAREFAWREGVPADADTLEREWRYRVGTRLNAWCQQRDVPEVQTAFNGRGYFGGAARCKSGREEVAAASADVQTPARPEGGAGKRKG